ncbi:hypothetical protein XELAEV_18008090mg [Xenopus laevis]|uniref:Uncharacterized protein n=1 Tax=Xenopus laevis TaxID=8355 RepID=A0A974E3J3_XENLA|nr:hypothetical protein XELAEV_18008090mg [Xenopus laevis]
MRSCEKKEEAEDIHSVVLAGITRGLEPRQFIWWVYKGLTHIRHYLLHNKIISWTVLQDRYAIPDQERYRYNQIRHFLITLEKTFSFSPLTFFETLCLYRPQMKGSLSYLNRQCTSSQPIVSLTYVKNWTAELSLTMDEQNWQTIFTNTMHTSVNILA